MKLTEAHVFWLCQIDRNGDLMTVVPGDIKALIEVMDVGPHEPQLVREIGNDAYELTDAGRAALRAEEAP